MRTSLHRLLSKTTRAAYDIGDDLPNEPIHFLETQRKMKQALARRGEVSLNPKSRAYALWVKIKNGAIKGAVVAAIRRDHAKQFANFDKQEQLLSAKGAA